MWHGTNIYISREISIEPQCGARFAYPIILLLVSQFQISLVFVVMDIKFVIIHYLKNFMKLVYCHFFPFVVWIGYKFKGYIEGYYYNPLTTRIKHFTMESAFYLWQDINCAILVPAYGKLKQLWNFSDSFVLYHITGAAEAVEPEQPWLYQYLRPIIMDVAFCGCVSSCACAVCSVENKSLQFYCGLDDHLGKIYIAGLAVATSQLATTDLRCIKCIHINLPDFIFPKRSFEKKSVMRDLSNTLFFFKVAFSSLQWGWGHSFLPHLHENV